MSLAPRRQVQLISPAGAAPAETVGPITLVLRCPRAASLSVSASASGLFRVADDVLDRFELYLGIDGPPDFSAEPWQTFTALPFTTPALDPDHVYRLVTRKRNAWGLLSQNVDGRIFDVDADGDELPSRPSDPDAVDVTPGAAGTVSVTARYAYPLDGPGRADKWLIYLRSDGSAPDPASDTPIELAMAVGDAVARLSFTSDPFAEGTTVKVIVRTRRGGAPDVDSLGATVHTGIATLLGPDAPGSAGAFMGAVAEQKQ